MVVIQREQNKHTVLTYLISIFSATLSGMALSILTLSLTDKFCKLFTSCSLLFPGTHDIATHGIGLCSAQY